MSVKGSLRGRCHGPAAVAPPAPPAMLLRRSCGAPRLGLGPALRRLALGNLPGWLPPAALPLPAGVSLLQPPDFRHWLFYPLPFHLCQILCQARNTGLWRKRPVKIITFGGYAVRVMAMLTDPRQDFIRLSVGELICKMRTGTQTSWCCGGNLDDLCQVHCMA